MESGIRHKLDVVVFALVALLVSAGGVHAQGLLLGAADSTYYVAKRGSAWSVLRMPGYWVPRDDGFWTARSEIPVQLFPEAVPTDTTEEGEDEGEEYLSNEWCFGANLVAHRFGAKPRYGKQDENCDSDSRASGSVWVTFLGPQHVGFDMDLVTDTRNGYDKGSLLTWIDTVARVGYTNDFEPSLPEMRLLTDSAVIEQAWRKCKGLAADEEEDYSLDDIGVGLTRVRGRWTYYSRQAGMATVARGQPEGTCEMPIRVPREVIGFDEITFDWSKLPRDVKRVADTFVSPSRDVLGVLTRDGELLLYRLEGGVPRERLFATRITNASWCGLQMDREPEDCTPTVMVQWATGNHVERWWNKLKQIKESN